MTHKSPTIRFALGSLVAGCLLMSVSVHPSSLNTIQSWLYHMWPRSNSKFVVRASAPSSWMWYGYSQSQIGYRRDRYSLSTTHDIERGLARSHAGLSPTDPRYAFSVSGSLHRNDTERAIFQVEEHYRGIPLPWFGTVEIATFGRDQPAPRSWYQLDEVKINSHLMPIEKRLSQHFSAQLQAGAEPRKVWHQVPAPLLSTPQRTILWIPAIISLAFWTLIAALLLWPASKLLHRWRARRAQHICRKCGYHRKSLPLCPECGTANPYAAHTPSTPHS
jgi:hypothetical protein